MIDMLGNKWDEGCVACAMAGKLYNPVGNIIKETENFILHQDIEVPIKGFLIIISKKHIKSIAQLTIEEMHELLELCYHARKALMALPDIIECTLIQEERSEHFHIWIFPRYEWMDNQFDNSLTSIRSIMKYAKENMKTQSNINEVISIVEKLFQFLK